MFQSTTPRVFLTATANEKKVIFAGGHDEVNNSFNTVDIYDVQEDEWSIAELSVARTGLGAVYACDR
ncbi:MAG: kelch repeat-containing protein, partial [Bacteroidota bacterium]